MPDSTGTFILAIATIIQAVAMAAQMVTVVIAVIAVFYSAKQVRDGLVTNLMTMSNQHNWELLQRYDKLPPMLPAWEGLNENEWAWRVLLLNHLNLLRLAYSTHTLRLGGWVVELPGRELEVWKDVARYWFRAVGNDPRDTYQIGHRVLRQILRREEGYPAAFRQWLVRSNIIPDHMISD